MSKEWRKVTDSGMPPMGVCLEVMSVNRMDGNRIEHKYPVYYLEMPYEKDRAFYFGNLDNPLLKNYSEVIAWRPMHEDTYDPDLIANISNKIEEARASRLDPSIWS